MTMLSGGAEPLLDDFAVTGTSLLYCDAAQFSWRCHEIIGLYWRGGPAPSPIREEGSGPRQRSVEVVEAGHILAGDLAAHAR